MKTSGWDGIIEHGITADHGSRGFRPTGYDITDIATKRNERERACCCLIHQKKGHTAEAGQARDLQTPASGSEQ